MRAALEGQLTSGWERFQDVVAVLVAAGALAPKTLKVCMTHGYLCTRIV
jgi:hypothetical protein